ncbi:hypothetical protein ACFQ3S_11015 [Mucilaginibacter terrae]|uniref:hypothetical protein n=1 Tax=Mucilaginibacter terrae TaxID=1955052 RepID=UPI003641F85C
MSNKTGSIFELILQSKSVQSAETQSSFDLPLVNKTNFFTESGASGYISKPPFLRVVGIQTEQELREFDNFLKELSIGKVKIKTNLSERDDKDGRKYVWIDIQRARGLQPYKFFSDERMSEFIADYLSGKINCSLTLEELYLEATNATPQV